MRTTNTFLSILAFLVFLFYGIILAAQNCSGEECLWPGDANRNGVCNNMDLLWIGLAHQDFTGGPNRENATVSWTPQTPPDDWEGGHPVSGINYKYADIDGSGWIDGGDLNFFPDLYGQMNDQFTSFLGHEVVGDDLYFTVSNPNPAPGETVQVSIHLGSADNPIENIYGIAFTVEVDTAIVEEYFTTFSNLGGWMNTADNNLFQLAKIGAEINIMHPEFAFVTRSGQGVSGFGEIATMDIVIEDVIIGINGEPLDSVALSLNFKRVLGLNAQEEDMMITIKKANLLVNQTSIIKNPIPNINITPQAQGLLINSSIEIDHVAIFNMAGQIVYRRSLHGTELEIFTSTIPAGIYFLHIQTPKGLFVRKIPIVN